ncbi:DUF1643 domain-containing protein [Maribacter luteus]|uniref:DUF1643 domain-containing protein n=1 Tax=Maribacter luteus TaxID=2594478 RepID=A0A6I2MJ59_9FLAO|nr:DUF1643 domain-containing protein [Maribacter luteus]MRX62595.1 DUF1643 domain-containing protein [Maribacter luteus]
MDIALKPIVCIPEKDPVKRFLLGKKGKNEFLAVALNPSTANEDTLDPTSRNIEHLAIKNGCDGWYMVNLYPGRTSKPEFLPKEPDPLLVKENIQFIETMLTSNKYNITKVLLCWGNGVDCHNYLKESAKRIRSTIEEQKLPCYHLKLTTAKNPFHPAPTPVNRWLGGIENVKLNPY